MRLALVQMPNHGSVELNLNKSLQAIKVASENGADLVLFPEVQLTEFFPQCLICILWKTAGHTMQVFSLVKMVK